MKLIPGQESAPCGSDQQQCDIHLLPLGFTECKIIVPTEEEEYFSESHNLT